ncbi:hypothetical protein MA16_Dca001309 [Dendrobium catenatum]|uniref:Uncharacterized protein n=1 Tax=Dendrobium catenatum TaxID=906689 RepID=A0A2I0WM14_9ASPA|nr:hypothetical protein MA16_Dca001309 [Dendrobium catenatum]
MFLHHCHLRPHFLCYGRHLLTPRAMVPNLQGHHQIPLCHSSQLHLGNRRLSSSHRQRSLRLPPSIMNADATLLDNNSFPSSLVCDPNTSLKYSNPTILAEIQCFNYKIFNKSIIFILYDTPVNESNLDECDAT